MKKIWIMSFKSDTIFPKRYLILSTVQVSKFSWMIRDEGIFIKCQGLVVFIHKFFSSINSSTSVPFSCTEMPYCTNATVSYLRHIWIYLYLDKSVQLDVNLDLSSNVREKNNSKQNILAQSITTYRYFLTTQQKKRRSTSGNSQFNNACVIQRHENQFL